VTRRCLSPTSRAHSAKPRPRQIGDAFVFGVTAVGAVGGGAESEGVLVERSRQRRRGQECLGTLGQREDSDSRVRGWGDGPFGVDFGVDVAVLGESAS
jgi:hypothetical protein